MTFILNSNPTSLSFYESWLFNMVSKPSLARGPRFEPHLCNLFPICLFESPWRILLIKKKSSGRILFGLFDSSRAGMGLHIKEGVKEIIFILKPNPTSLSF